MTPADLRQRRHALGLTLTSLAERLGVDRQTVWRWEQGKRALPAYLDLALRTVEGDAALFSPRVSHDVQKHSPD